MAIRYAVTTQGGSLYEILEESVHNFRILVKGNWYHIIGFGRDPKKVIDERFRKNVSVVGDLKPGELIFFDKRNITFDKAAMSGGITVKEYVNKEAETINHTSPIKAILTLQ